MAYSQNLKAAAQRHLRAGKVLFEANGGGDQPGCAAVAGYLFGIAGELAVKELMRLSGIAPKPQAERGGDPFFAHFPALKTMLGTATGRRAGELRRLSEDSGLFQHWEIAMRYAPATEIDQERVAAWKASAEKLIGRMMIA
jgi:hypothetical protein